MSITDELRKWAEDNTLRDRVLPTYPPQHAVHGVLETLLRIADRIDEAYERLEHENDGLRAELGSMSSDDTWLSAYMKGIRDSGSVCEDDSAVLEAHGLMLLPKDVDGEYIHIGDVMAYADNTKPMEVVALVPPAVFLTDDGPRYADMCRHYRAPTVEDVLREFAEKVIDSQIPGMHPTYEEAIAEYAAKLRLAGDAS